MNKLTKTLAPVFFVFLMVLISGCGIKNEPMSAVEPTVVNNQEIKNNNEKEIMPMLKNVSLSKNAWKVYQSEKYKFEIQVPDYFIEDTANFDNRANVAPFINTQLPKNVTFNDFYVVVEENDKKISEVKSKEDFINIFKEGRASDEFNNFKNFKIGDYKVISIEEVGGIIGRWTSYYLITDDYLFIFKYGTHLGKSKEETYKKKKEEDTLLIIKTFKEID